MPPPYLVVNVLIEQHPTSGWYAATSQDLPTLAASNQDLGSLVSALPTTIAILLYPDNGPLNVFSETDAVPDTVPVTRAYSAYTFAEAGV